MAAATASVAAGGGVPEGEKSVVFLEEVAGHDAIHCRILDIDMQVGASHRNHDVKIQLQFMGDATLNGEVVGFCTAGPGEEFGNGEERAEDGKDDCS